MNKRTTIIAALLAANIIATAGIIVHLAGGKARASSAFGTELHRGEKYALYIGLNDKDKRAQIISTDEARSVVNQICAKHVSGWTALDARGGWTEDDGSVTQEKTLVYEFYNATEEQLRAVMDEALAALNQSAILVEKRTSVYAYYGD